MSLICSAVDKDIQKLQSGGYIFVGLGGVDKDNIELMFTNMVQKTSPNKALIYMDLLVLPLQRNAFIGNVPLALTRQEFDLLYYLLINKGIVLTYEQIYRAIWNEEYDGSTYSTIKALIKRLRRKMAVVEGNRIAIQNKWGVGYSLPVC